MTKTDPLPNPPKLGLTEFDLPGEGGDRGFETPKGLRLRVKVRCEERSVHHPVMDKVKGDIASTAFNILITLSELNADNSVKQYGRALAIHGPHELPVGRAQMSQPDFDLDKVIMAAIEFEAIKIEHLLTKGRDQVAETLKKWSAI